MAVGRKTGGGSRKGIPNKATAAKAAAVAASGLTPLDFMLSVMRDPANDMAVRMDAAKGAAPYVHPKLAQVEHSGDLNATVKHQFTDRELARRVAFVLSKAVRDQP
jgi:hypothetical protein